MSNYETYISETCSCGAKFEVRSSDVGAMFRHKEFLAAHAVCREPVATNIQSCSPNIETIERLERAIEQIEGK